ncbi:MAG TPA: molybdopterin converting factor subunit 1 [Rhizomicrobium sp.]|jgi:molybdopterin synthase sulfur carrier subunit
MKVLYFAWVRQKIGCSDESLSLPPQVRTIAELIETLRARGPGYAEAFAEPQRLCAALNQEHVRFDAALCDEDELAFFPPVTGG